MKTSGLDACIEVALAILYAVGWVLLSFSDLRLLLLRWRMRHRLRTSRRELKTLSRPVRYVRDLLGASFRRAPDERIVFAAIGSTFALVLLVMHRNYTLLVSVALSAIIAVMPVLFLILKLELQRKKGSREGLPLLSELYRHYWSNHKNIYEAIEGVLAGRGEYPVFRKLLTTLLLQLRSAGSATEIREAVRRFSFSAGTMWGKMLGVCIRTAAEKGVDVSAGLRDISDQLTEAHKRVHERDRLNSEAVRMTVLLIPFLYAATLWMAVRYLGLSTSTLVRNQIATPEGLLFLTLGLMLFIGNLAALELLRNQKIDY